VAASIAGEYCRQLQLESIAAHRSSLAITRWNISGSTCDPAIPKACTICFTVVIVASKIYGETMRTGPPGRSICRKHNRFSIAAYALPLLVLAWFGLCAMLPGIAP
jgi:hypothetical protein